MSCGRPAMASTRPLTACATRTWTSWWPPPPDGSPRQRSFPFPMDKHLLKFRSASLADIELPAEVSRLRELAYNLWWSWNPQARRMFAHIQPGLWAIYRNPV
ncbi:MAG: DUF3417 domain-containing protein, partial [Thermaurantiacus sp.]